MMSRVFLAIPAYKPTSGLFDLIRDILRSDTHNQIEKIYVLDDGSGESFSALFSSVSENPKVTLLRHATNLGKGAALKTLFNTIAVTHQKPGESDETISILTADADGQHSAPDVLRLAAQKEPANLWIGSREFKKDIPFRSLFGNQLTRGVFWFFSGLKLSDTQSGLRRIPSKLAKECLRISLNGYDFELQMLLLAKNLEISISELPIQTIYIDGNKSSHFNPLKDSMRIYFVFIRYCSTSLITAASDFTVFVILRSLGAPLLTCQFGARAVGGSVAYFFAKTFVFKDRSGFLSLLKFASLVVVSGLLSFSLMRVFIESLHFPVPVAKLCAEGTLFAANFAIQREFIFTRKSQTE